MTSLFLSSRLVQLLIVGCLSLGLLVQVGCDDDGGGAVVDPVSPTPPNAPAGLVASSQSGAVALSWEEPDPTPVDPTAISYNLYRDTSPIEGLPEEPIATSITDLLFTDEDVQNGTTYYYRVTAASSPEVESEASNGAAATPFAPPPERP